MNGFSEWRCVQIKFGLRPVGDRQQIKFGLCPLGDRQRIKFGLCLGDRQFGLCLGDRQQIKFGLCPLGDGLIALCPFSSEDWRGSGSSCSMRVIWRDQGDANNNSLLVTDIFRWTVQNIHLQKSNISARGPTCRFYSFFTPNVDSSMLSREFKIYFLDLQRPALSIHWDIKQLSRSPISSIPRLCFLLAWRQLLLSILSVCIFTHVFEDHFSLSNSGFRYVAETPYCRCLIDLKYCDLFHFLF